MAGMTGLWDGALRDMRVLVADDNPDLGMLLETILTIAGADVTLVTDGLIAAKSLGRTDFDLLVCDAEMPGLGGRELCTRLRAAGHGIPIIIVSGHAGPQAALVSRAAGASAHLDKPFTPDALIGCCLSVLDAWCSI